MFAKKFASENLQEVVLLMTNEFTSITESRKKELSVVASYMSEQITTGKALKLTFICTHNSRRSHLSQIWAQTAAYYYDISAECFSGGTEATAFNPRAVDAIKRLGFRVSGEGNGTNPHYNVEFSDSTSSIIAFSKHYSDQFNPQSGYAAIMTCSDADENCPVVPGADKRFNLTYIDPKESDDTPDEARTYDMRSRQIGVEMFYLFSQINSSK